MKTWNMYNIMRMLLQIQDECIDPTNNQTTDHFNTATGLWEFGGKSTHVPREMSDIQLSRCVYLFH